MNEFQYYMWLFSTLYRIFYVSLFRQEYVDLLVNYKLTKSIESQYQAFHDGFYHVCGGIVLKLFQPMELMALITGNENYDWTELEKNTEYKVLIRNFDVCPQLFCIMC